MKGSRSSRWVVQRTSNGSWRSSELTGATRDSHVYTTWQRKVTFGEVSSRLASDAILTALAGSLSASSFASPTSRTSSIRCLGTGRVEQVIEAQGELSSLRRMQNEPFHRGRQNEQHLHRFMGVHTGRKYRYARLLAKALDPSSIPRPLERLLAYM